MDTSLENLSSSLVTTELTSLTHTDSDITLYNIEVESHSFKIAETDSLILELITEDQNLGRVYPCYSTSSTIWKCREGVKIHQTEESLLMLYVASSDESTTELGYISITKNDLLPNHESTILVKDIIDPFASESEPQKIQLRFMYKMGSPEPLVEEESDSVTYLQQLREIAQDLDEYYSSALGSPDDRPGKADLLHLVGVCYHSRFNAYPENRDDIDRSIIALNTCISLSPDPTMYGNSLVLRALGASYQTRYDAFGDLQDLNQAISAFERVVDLVPQDDPMFPYFLNLLGGSHMSRFRHKEDLLDIDEAMSLLQRAAHLASDSPTILSNFATVLHHRFERTGELDDLNEAIRVKEKVLLLIPEDYDDRPGMLNNLANSLQSRYDRSGDINDLNEAIKNHREALRLTPDGHPSLPGWLNNLGCVLQNRFQSTGDLVDIDEAIPLQRRAISLNSDGHPDVPGHLSNLSHSYELRFSVTQDENDLEEGRKMLQRATDLVPGDHALKCRFHLNLGENFRQHYIHLGNRNTSLLGQAKEQFIFAAKLSTGDPYTRILAASQWAISSLNLGDQAQYVEAYTIAFDLVPRLAWIGNTISNRHQQLRKVAHLTKEATSIAIGLEQYSLAIQWLEQGRCIVRNQLINLRTPLENLYKMNPELASELQRVGTALETHGHMEKNTSRSIDDIHEISSQNDVVKRHRQLAKQWDELLDRTRQIDGFETFLKPISFSHLSNTIPDTGPVIVLSGHAMSKWCDALIVMRDSDEVIYIQLDNFSYSKAENLRKRLSRCLSSYRLRTREARSGRPDFRALGSNDIYYILSELWTCIVKPLLDGLGYSPCTSSSPPRVWFCPTGPLSFLPIHAAGIYQSIDGVRGPAISDYVVASYTPSVSAIAEIAQESKHRPFLGMLSVSQPDLPDLPPIPSTSTESLGIYNAFDASNLTSLRLDGSSATIRSVVEGMQSMSWVHLACHAVQDTSDPAKSGFYLQDGCLDFSNLVQKHFSHADFAFLSACQTSMGDEQLSEEAVHLASGILSAGYRGVIATMWSIDDEQAPQISQHVYSHLLTNIEPNCGPQSSQAAHALHYAIQHFRKEHGDDEIALLSWVPFIHWGL